MIQEVFGENPQQLAELTSIAIDQATELLALGKTEEALLVAEQVLCCLASVEDDTGRFAPQRILAQRLREAAG